MKTFAIVALAGAASSVTAQDLVICVDDLDGDGRWVVTAEFVGAIPGSATAIGAIWSDTSFRIDGDGSDITIDAASANAGYTSAIFGAPMINNGASATFVGLQPVGLGNPDPSNPLSVVEFDYAGNPNALSFELFGQNTGVFTGDPAQPFGTVLTYLDANNNPGAGTFAVEIKIPAPASAAVLGLGGLAAVRRRR
ncbi:MAG: MYXO-CTERM sorting domain-containing protein [Planctomycetota bacterium]